MVFLVRASVRTHCHQNKPIYGPSVYKNNIQLLGEWTRDRSFDSLRWNRKSSSRIRQVSFTRRARPDDHRYEFETVLDLSRSNG